jgi:acyl carrier protein
VDEIGRKVRAIVAEKLGVVEEKVTDEANFIEDLGADSLDTVELVMALEESFHIEIPDEAAEKIATFRDVLDFVRSQLAHPA